MPANAVVDIPPCLICGSRSDLPPSWLRDDDDGKTKLFVICGECGFDRDDAELERRVMAKVSAPVDAMA